MAKPLTPLLFAKYGNIYDIIDKTITDAEAEAMIDTINAEDLPEGVLKFGNIDPDSPWTLTADIAEDVEVETWDQVAYIDPGKIKWGSTVTRVDMTPSSMRECLGATFNPATKLWGVGNAAPRIKRLLVVSEDEYGTRYGQLVPKAVIKLGEAPKSAKDGLVGFPLSIKFLRDAAKKFFYFGGELLQPADAEVEAVLDVGDGSIDAITVIDGGEEYPDNALVAITGDGIGATAHAVVIDGVVTAVIVDTPGSGYDTAEVTISR